MRAAVQRLFRTGPILQTGRKHGGRPCREKPETVRFCAFSRSAVPPGRGSLVQAATRAIAKHGFAGTTVRVICAEAQVCRGRINHHIGDELLLLYYCRRDISRTCSSGKVTALI
jgi:hypothetical protein